MLTYNRYFHPLSKFPGPFWAAQTDLWRVYHLCTKRLPDTLQSLHLTHGRVVRIGPNELSFQSPAAIAPIYKSGRRVVKSSFYDGFTTFLPNLFGTRDEEVRRLAPPLLSFYTLTTGSFTRNAVDRWPIAFRTRRSRRWSISSTSTSRNCQLQSLHKDPLLSISRTSSLIMLTISWVRSSSTQILGPKTPRIRSCCLQSTITSGLDVSMACCRPFSLTACSTHGETHRHGCRTSLEAEPH
jgi:hypothetical protein